MRTFLLIMGVWLLVGVATMYVFVRLAALGSGADPRFRASGRAPRRRRSVSIPVWIFSPLALGCAAALMVGDLALAPDRRAGAAVEATAPRAAQLAEVRERERRQARRPVPVARRARRAAPRAPAP